MRLSRARGVLLAATALTLVASGCTTGAHRTEDSNTLTMLTHYGSEPHRSGLQKLIDEWNSNNPDIQIETHEVSFDDLLQTITVRQTARQSPDIVQGYSLWGGQLAASDVLSPPPDDIAADITENYSDAAAGSVTVDDQVLGYPTEVQTYAMYYNKRILKESGVDEPPRTWDELEEAARATTKTDASGNIEVAGFGLESGWDSAVVHPFLALTQAAGGKQLNAEQNAAAFDSPAGEAALSLEKRLIDNGHADPSAEIFSQFQSERSAIAINAAWWIGSLQAGMGEKYEDIGVAPIPGPDPGDQGSVGYSFFNSVTSQSKQPDKAWEFLRWLNAQPDSDGVTPMGRMQFSFGNIPGRASDAEVLTADAKDPNYGPFVDAIDYALPEANPPGGQEMKVELQNQIESVWTGDISVEEALANAAEATDAVIDRQGKR